MATNKSVRKIVLVSLLTAFGLMGCNEIIEQPADGPILPETSVGSDPIYNNSLEIIYDQIREGTLPSDVMDQLMYEYAINLFGRYNVNVGSVSKKDEDLAKDVTLKTAVKDVTGSYGKYVAGSTATAFIEAHKGYWYLDENGDRVTTEEGKQIEIANLVATWKTIDERIACALYDKISGGSYSKRNIFSEKEFLASLRFDLQKVADYDKEEETKFVEGSGKLYSGLIDATVEEKDVFSHFLHREYYQEGYKLTDPDETHEIVYVENEILPSIYSELLTERYIKNETYSTLGRSFARKVNILAIPANTEYTQEARYLTNYFVENFVADKTGKAVVDATSFNSVSNFCKGAWGDDQTLSQYISKDSEGKYVINAATLEGKLLQYLYENKAVEIGEDYIDAQTTEYYVKGTSYGDMMEKYSKIKDSAIETDTSIESEFTSNNTYTKETGKAIKANEIRLKDYVTTGWGIKNGGFSFLPDELRTRLFNIGVANALDNEETEDRVSGGEYKIPDNENKYVAKVNGKYYLKNGTKENADQYSDLFYYDSSSSTYYIVQIEEAVSASKLSLTGSANYKVLAKDGGQKMFEITNEVCKLFGTNDSYTSLAKEYWIEKMNIVTHDDVIYDYFVSNFPDIFD